MTNNYKLMRNTKSGKIITKNIVGPTLTIATFGVIGICAIFNTKKLDYKYDSSYATYSEQLETTEKVDVSPSLENDINKLQEISTLVDEYKNSDIFFDKSNACEKLIGNYDYIIDTSLGILKTVIAEEHGVNEENISVSYEKSDGTWLAYGEGLGSISLHGDEYEVAEAIGGMQKNYNIEHLANSTQEELSDYVNTCGYLVNRTAFLVANKSPKSK